MKKLLLIFFTLFFISCGDENTTDNKPKECEEGTFLDINNNCIDPCVGVDCGEGNCVATSATDISCTEPQCGDQLFLNDENRCVNPCENQTIDCGDGECVATSAYQYSCTEPVCEEGSFVSQLNICVDPCEDIDCGLNKVCISISAEQYQCDISCQEDLGYFENSEGECVDPCFGVDCGLGDTECNPISANEFNCVCDLHHILDQNSGKCLEPIEDYEFYDETFENPEPAGFESSFNQDWVATHTPHHNGYDKVFKQSDQQYIEGKFQYGDLRKDLEDEWISIYVYPIESDQRPEWALIGREMTDSDGRIYHTISNDNKFTPGLYLVKLFVEGDTTFAHMYIKVLEDDVSEPFVVFDIDGTLTTGDREISIDYINELWNGDDNTAEMYPGAPEIAKYYYERGYNILYLTARPYWLSEKSLEWLVNRGFPRGLMHTYREDYSPCYNLDDTSCETFSDTILTNHERTAQFKTAYLEHWVSKGMSLEFAYGNAETDIEAYYNLGLPGEKIFIIGENGGAEGTTAVSSYPEHLLTLPE